MNNTTFYNWLCVPIGFLIGFGIALYIAGIESLLDILFHKRLISAPGGSTYMHRWFIIRTRNFALFLHKFVRSDYDRALHDHPWDFIVIPVWRGYIEHSASINDFLSHSERISIGEMALVGQRKRRVWPIIGTRFRRAEYMHRVELIQGKPSWSFFFRFRKRRHWGFWCPQGWTPFQEGREEACSE